MNSDISQFILVGVIVILTVILIVLGVQIFFILRQSQKTLQKLNKVLDGASGIVGNAAFFNNPMVKDLVGTALALLSGKKKTGERKLKIQEPKEVRRFFKKSVR